MSARRLTVRFPADDPHAAAAFWSRLLEREVDGALLSPTDRQVGVRFVGGPALIEPLHLHVIDPDVGQAALVARALDLGARPVDVGQTADEGHVVLADVAGHPFCVIPDDTTFLAGCGPLGEVACDGGREVGLHWSMALGWPLVWDQDDETAIQSPAGGTKVAWGGSSGASRPIDESRFEIVPG